MVWSSMDWSTVAAIATAGAILVTAAGYISRIMLDRWQRGSSLGKKVDDLERQINDLNKKVETDVNNDLVKLCNEVNQLYRTLEAQHQTALDRIDRMETKVLQALAERK